MSRRDLVLLTVVDHSLLIFYIGRYSQISNLAGHRYCSIGFEYRSDPASPASKPSSAPACPSSQSETALELGLGVTALLLSTDCDRQRRHSTRGVGIGDGAADRRWI